MSRLREVATILAPPSRRRSDSDSPLRTVFAGALAGGSPRDAGAAAPADCYVRAAGTLHDATLDAAFIGVDTDTFAYSTARAEKEGRRLRIVFRPGVAEVTRADTDGDCGLGAALIGSYRRTASVPPPKGGRTSPTPPSTPSSGVNLAGDQPLS